MSQSAKQPKDRIAVAQNAVAFFSEREAWTYFRIAAFSEAIGWTTLISGIGISRYLMHGDSAAVDIAGQFHGTIFLVYIVSVFVFCSSLKWSRKLTIIAALASIPPYGTLIFEKYMAHMRAYEAGKSRRQIVVRAIILKNGQLLAVQPSDSGFWCLPGGAVVDHESSHQALIRILEQQTGVRPTIKRLLYVYQYRHRNVERLEFFFEVANPKDFATVTLKNSTLANKDLDEMEFINLEKIADFEPAFLSTEDLVRITTKKQWDTKFMQL